MSKLLIPNTCQVPNVLLDKIIPYLPAGAVRVLLVIVRYTFGFGKSSDRISYGQLSKATRLGRRQVIQAVKTLGDLVNVIPGAKGRGANEYSLNLNIETGNLLSSENNLTGEKKCTGEISGQEVVAKTAPFQTHISKPNNSTAKVPESRSKKRKLTPPEPGQIESFERFYAAYPRHVDKQNALKSWIRLAPDEPLAEKIMAGVARYCEEKADSDPKYIKYPAAWLNGRRWEDEPSGIARGQAKPEVKDLGNGLVEVEDRRMDQRTYEARYGRSNI